MALIVRVGGAARSAAHLGRSLANSKDTSTWFLFLRKQRRRLGDKPREAGNSMRPADGLNIFVKNLFSGRRPCLYAFATGVPIMVELFRSVRGKHRRIVRGAHKHCPGESVSRGFGFDE